MKKCDYCGRENCDEAAHCRECGTKFPDAPALAKPVKPRDRTWQEWLTYTLRFIGIVLVTGLLYLLSFGPVEHYCGKVTSRTSTATTNTVNGQTIVRSGVRTVRYPGWVGIVYYPAFVMQSGNGGNSLYARYLRWWDDQSSQ